MEATTSRSTNAKALEALAYFRLKSEILASNPEATEQEIREAADYLAEKGVLV